MEEKMRALAPTLLGMAGHFYWVGALLLSGLFLFGAFGFHARRDAPSAARQSSSLHSLPWRRVLKLNWCGPLRRICQNGQDSRGAQVASWQLEDGRSCKGKLSLIWGKWGN